MIALNTAVAEALTNFKTKVDKLIEQGEVKEKAILKVLKEDIVYCKPICFNGNGYSEEWKEEAKKRGLDCESSCPIIFDRYLDEKSIKMFESMNVMNKFELQARNEIKWETYIKRVQIEARIFGDICINHIIPIVTRYQTSLLDNVQKMKQIFNDAELEELSSNNIAIIRNIAKHESFIIEHVRKLIDARKVANKIESNRERAIAYHDTVAPLIEEIRTHVDKLEIIVDDELWPLPKYRELLFII
jgi:glutamine synthetase